MFPRWNTSFRSLNYITKRSDFSAISRQRYAMATAAATVASAPSPTKQVVSLDKMFWSKPCSLALAPDFPLRIDEPKYEGLKLLFYSKQSKSMANVIYKRVASQVDTPAIYDVFNLEKTFRTTFSLLVLHMWFCLRRLKEEGKEGVELGQYLYKIYNHDMKLNLSKVGVKSKWVKELERIFYENVAAYDPGLLPEAKLDYLQNVIWRNIFSDDGSSKPDDTALRALQNVISRNIFSDDGSSKPDDAALRAVQAMARYVRREVSCLSLTDKEAMFSGNFMFTPLENTSSGEAESAN